MPRKRQTNAQANVHNIQQAIAQAINSIPLGQSMIASTKRGRPRKATKVKKLEFDDVTIVPVANGYFVQSTTTGKDIFVFEDLEKVFEFIKAKLKPTAEQKAFLDKI